MDEKAAVEALREVKEILDKHGIEYWLDCGTLLGAIRDRKFIPWDSDIDLGMWEKDFDKIVSIVDYLRDMGFEIHFGLYHIGIIRWIRNKKYIVSIDAYQEKGDKAVTFPTIIHPRERYYIGNKIHIDIIKNKIRYAIKYFIWLFSSPPCIGDGPRFIPVKIHLILSKSISSLSSHYRQMITEILEWMAKKLGYKFIYVEVPIKYFKKLSTIKFYGVEFKIPSPPEEYLEYRYGKDWKIPKENYIWYREDEGVKQLD